MAHFCDSTLLCHDTLFYHRVIGVFLIYLRSFVCVHSYNLNHEKAL